MCKLVIYATEAFLCDKWYSICVVVNSWAETMHAAHSTVSKDAETFQ